MLLFAIDDEPKMLRLLHRAIEEAVPDAVILDFSLGMAAVRAIEEQNLYPDVVFSDIQMPELDGLELAVRLKQLVPETRIVFVTGYSDYAVDAYRLHVSGYVMKPVEAQRIREELDSIKLLPLTSKQPTSQIKVQCFGAFEVYWRDQPLLFGRKQTKELFAYLIDREGESCTAEEISTVLWENETNMRITKARIRQLISDMKKTLSKIGMDQMLVRRSGQIAIRRDMVDCDYYRMLEGDMEAVNAYRGEYMSRYSWAELTKGKLHFRRR